MSLYMQLCGVGVAVYTLWLTVENTDLCISTCIYTLGGRVALAPPCAPVFKERVPFFDAVFPHTFLITPSLPQIPYSMGRVGRGRLLSHHLPRHMGKQTGSF